MFNEERKKQFIRERQENTELATNINSWFRQAEFFEETYGRDMCDWSPTEIIAFMKFLSTPRVSSLVLFVNTLKIYTDWCLKNLLVEDNQNHYVEISMETIYNCIDIEKFRTLVISREDLLKNIAKLPNYCDQFIFLGLFEGIKRNQICKVRASNMEGNTLCIGSEKLEVSDDLAKIIHKAGMETERQSMGKLMHVYEYVQDDTIIRALNRKNTAADKNILIRKRFQEGLNFMGLNPSLTQKDIMESGRIVFIRKLMAEKGITVEQALREPNRTIVENRYGRIQQITSYLYTYGKLV